MAARYSKGVHAARIIQSVVFNNQWSFSILADCMGLSKSFVVDCANGLREMSKNDVNRLRSLASNSWGDWKVDESELDRPKKKSSAGTDKMYMRYLSLQEHMLAAQVWLANYEPIYQNHLELSMLLRQQLHYLKSKPDLAAKTRELEIKYHYHALAAIRLEPKLHNKRERLVALEAQVKWYEKECGFAKNSKA